MATKIVRGADTAGHDLGPEAFGLRAISQRRLASVPDDHAMLQQDMGLYDTLCTWCRSPQGEVHNGTPLSDVRGSAWESSVPLAKRGVPYEWTRPSIQTVQDRHRLAR